MVAPADARVPVTDPAEHTEHATVDALLYCPAAHRVQFVLPTDNSPSVTEPEAQMAHATLESLLN